MLNDLKNSRTLYMQWRNLNSICPDRLCENWRINSNNLLGEYEMFCSSLVILMDKQRPEVNADVNMATGLTMLEFKYQKSKDDSEFILIPKLQSTSTVHDPEFILEGKFTETGLTDNSKLTRMYHRKLRSESNAPPPSRRHAVNREWIFADGNAVASYKFAPTTVHIIRVPKSFLEMTYSTTLPNIPKSDGELSVSDIMDVIQFKSLVKEPVITSYSAEVEEYNQVLMNEYSIALRKYKTEHLPQFQEAAQKREKAIYDYMEEHNCKDYDVPANVLPKRVMAPIAPKIPDLQDSLSRYTFSEWNQSNLIDKQVPISEDLLNELYDNYFSDTDIARISSILSQDVPEEWNLEDMVYLDSEELSKVLNSKDSLTWQRDGIRKYLSVNSNNHLRTTNLGVKLRHEH